MPGPVVSKLCAGLLATQLMFPSVRNFCTGPNCPPVQPGVGASYVEEVPLGYDLPMGPTAQWVWEPGPTMVESEPLQAPTEEPDSAIEGTPATPASDDSTQGGTGEIQELDQILEDAKEIQREAENRKEALRLKSMTQAKQSAATAKATSGRWVLRQLNTPAGGIVARTSTDWAGRGCGCPDCTCGPNCECGASRVRTVSYASSGGANYVTRSYASSGGANWSRTVTYQASQPTYVTRESTYTRRVLFPNLFPRLRGLR